MTPSRFQKRIITIDLADLADFHRDGLAEIAERIPFRNEEDLISVVLSRGILDLLSAPDDREPLSAKKLAESMNAANERMRELQSKYASPGSKPTLRAQTIDPHRVPFGMKQSLQEQHAMEAEHDKEKARFRRDLGLTEDVEAHAHRHLPQALSVRLSEEMRQALEDFLDAHPDLDENDALSILVRRGLEHTAELEEVVQTAREKQASKLLVLAEKLCARSKRRCR